MRIMMIALLSLGMTVPAFCNSGALRVCETDTSGTKKCRTITYEVKPDRIMGMPADEYARGIKEGKCMPSPAGPHVCGGG